MKKVINLLSIMAILAVILALNPVATLAQGDVTCESDVVVQSDDWLSKISEKFLGDVLAFQAVADATNVMASSDSSYATIDDVNVIEPGWKLCIPPAEQAGALLADAPSVAAAAPEETYTIALVYGVKNDGFYVTMENGAQAMADKLGVEFLADGPEQFDATLQTPIVDAMIAKGIDALLIAATDKQAMVEPMKRTHDAGIKVISVDTFVGDGDYVNGPVAFPLSYVGSNNVLGGQIACEALIEDMGGSGKIYIQNVKPGISTTDQRQQGCEEAIATTNGAVELIGVDFNDDSSAIAAEQTAAVLQREPELNAIFGTNLFSAEVRLKQWTTPGLAGIVKIANFDAPEAAVEDLRNGVVDMVIAQKPGDIGSVAVNYAYMALTGRESAIAPRVPTGYVVITRDNVDTPEAQGAIYKSSVETAAAPEETYTIALVYGVKNDGFYVTMENGAQAMADKLGVEFLADGPEQFDATLQTPIVDAMIAKGIDALLIAATDKQAMVEPMKRTHDAGIKVISVDTFVGDGDYVNGPVAFPLSYVGSNNVLGGQIACEALIEDMGGSGKIYIQNVKPGISTTDQRQQGCEEAIATTNGAVELIGVDFNDDSSAIAAEQTAAVLQREPELNAIFGTNLFSARGAAQAVDNAGLAGIVKIANFDAPEAAVEDLRNGVVDMVIAQKPGDIGSVAVNYAYMALTGRESAIAPRVPTGYVVITRDNVDTPEAQGAIYKSQ